MLGVLLYYPTPLVTFMKYYQFLALSPHKIAGTYLVFGIVWIATTDWLVVTFVATPETVTALQTVKGWLFVGLSALLIFGLTYRRQQQLEQSRENLERATEQLQVMNRVFRHNIRNEITVIQGYIELVQEQLDDCQKQAQLGIARQTAKKISSISEKMHSINEVDLSAPSAEAHIDLIDVIEDEIRTIRETYPEVDIYVDAPSRADVRGDSSLHQAIGEILENAVVHNSKSPDECEIDVDVDRTNGWVTLEIDDNGPAIDREELAPLEAEEETDLTHMSGVGLWLTTWITNYHGGTLQFDTCSRQGTTVRFEFESRSQLPFAEEASRTLEQLVPEGGEMARQ